MQKILHKSSKCCSPPNKYLFPNPCASRLTVVKNGIITVCRPHVEKELGL